MARLQLIIPLILWAIWLNKALAANDWVLTGPLAGTAIYLASLAIIVLLVRRLARMAMRRNASAAAAGINNLQQTVFAARWMILVLHAFALFSLGFGHFIIDLSPHFADRVESVPAILSIIPVAAAWLGLVWAQHPLDRAVREQNALYAFEFGEPVYAIPSFTQHMLAAFRLQILFTLVPVLAIGVMRDVMRLVISHYGGFGGRFGDDAIDLVITLTAMASVFLLSPELLCRVLPTQPLPPSELRDRLEALCRRLRLRYREILLWRTHHTLDNAAVMGVIPQVRYILLSDLLIATMTQDQIEAVFAHEAGHVAHRHMVWYLMFFLTLTLSLGAVADAAAHWPPLLRIMPATDAATLVPMVGIIAFFVLFGMLSRSMERQADVFAAATMTATPIDAHGHRIGRDGVALFCSALAKVARVNNMPLDSNAVAFGRSKIHRLYARLVNHSANWLHGSIRSRLDYLQSLIDAPERVARFDRKMLLIRLTLLATLAASIALTISDNG